MILTKDDNDVIIKHQYDWNKTVGIDGEKMAIDVYVNSIEFIQDDVVFNCKIIEPVLDPSCGINLKNVNISKRLGEKISLKLSGFSSTYRKILEAAIREIKLKKLGV